MLFKAPIVLGTHHTPPSWQGCPLPWHCFTMRAPIRLKTGGGRVLSDHDKWAIVHHMKRGFTISRVAKIVGCARDTVYTWWRRFSSTRSVSNLPKCGRKRALSEAGEQHALGLLTNADSNTADQAAQLLHEEGLTTRRVHRSTVVRAARRAAQGAGIKLMCQRGMPPKAMTAATMAKRIAFAKANKRTDWRCVMFTDRKKFQFRYPGSKVAPCRWVCKPASSNQPAVHQPNHAMVLNVYAGITRYGATAVHVVAGSSKHKSTFTNQQGKAARNITSAEYKAVLQTFLKEGQRLFSSQGISSWILQQDNDPTHRCAAEQLQQWNASKGSNVQLLSPWPPNSPDLNLIENVWSWVQQQVDKQGCQTFEEFKQAVIHHIAAVPKQHLSNLFDSMRSRLEDVLENGGGATKH